MFYFRNKQLLGQRAEMGLQSIKRTLFINFMYSGMSPGIDHAAHAYGFLGGAFFSYLFGPRLLLKKEPGYNRVIGIQLVSIPNRQLTQYQFIILLLKSLLQIAHWCHTLNLGRDSRISSLY